MYYCCVCGRKADHPARSFHCQVGLDTYHYCHWHAFIGRAALTRQYKQLNKTREKLHKYIKEQCMNN